QTSYNHPPTYFSNFIRSLINDARSTSRSLAVSDVFAYCCRNPGCVRTINSCKICWLTCSIKPNLIPSLTSDRHFAASFDSLIHLFFNKPYHRYTRSSNLVPDCSINVSRACLSCLINCETTLSRSLTISCSDFPRVIWLEI